MNKPLPPQKVHFHADVPLVHTEFGLIPAAALKKIRERDELAAALLDMLDLAEGLLPVPQDAHNTETMIGKRLSRARALAKLDGGK